MSRHYASHTPESVVRVIQRMDTAEIEQQFGIEIDDDGSVWDACEGRTFKTVSEWALYMDDCEEQLSAATACKNYGRYAFDDEY